MGLDTASPGDGRLRPRLWMVFAAVGALAFLLLLLGLAWVRVYDNQLIRNTESELIAQGVVVAEVVREGFARRVPADYGLPRSAGWPTPMGEDGELKPILPSLRAGDPTLPAPEDPKRAPAPAEPTAAIVGTEVSALLGEVGRTTLAAIRVVDQRGVVVGSSSVGVGTTLADRPEVEQALLGAPTSVLRRRVTEHGDAPLQSLSRNTGVRIFVAIPIIEGERVRGAVVLSRTPMTLAKSFYADRWNLTATALVLLGALTLVSLVASAALVRPLRAVVKQARRIALGDRAALDQPKPAIAELAELSDSLSSLAASLRARGDYIQSFVANVSHEFKTPLASIQGAIELLRHDQGQMLPAQRDRFLANVEADARRLTELVRRLLELARADAMEPSRAETDVGQVLAAIAERAGREGIPVRVEGTGAQRKAALPAEVLDSVLWQLVTNARQHGGPEAKVTLAVEPGVRDGVRIEVSDDGGGISEANRARIFEAFFTTARDRGGTGLGLNISRSMLRAFGGSLELLPAGGGGARFALELKAA